jgi:hypothetical protein
MNYFDKNVSKLESSHGSAYHEVSVRLEADRKGYECESADRKGCEELLENHRV